MSLYQHENRQWAVFFIFHSIKKVEIGCRARNLDKKRASGTWSSSEHAFYRNDEAIRQFIPF